MQKVEVRKGDLFTYPEHLAHGVNCAGAMGKGIAIKFKEHWPEMYQEYRDRCHRGLIIPGACWSWWDDFGPVYNHEGRLVEAGRFIFNLAIKSHWRLPASYVSLKGSLKNLVREMDENGINEVAMPWIGCGLGGLQQKTVQKLMEKALDGSDKKFIIYEL